MIIRPSPEYLWTLWDLVWVTVIATIAWQYRGESWAHVVIGWSMALVLLWRRRRPVPVLLGIAFLAFAQFLVIEATGPDDTTARGVVGDARPAPVAVVSGGGRRSRRERADRRGHGDAQGRGPDRRAGQRGPADRGAALRGGVAHGVRVADQQDPGGHPGRAGRDRRAGTGPRRPAGRRPRYAPAGRPAATGWSACASGWRSTVDSSRPVRATAPAGASTR